MELLKNLCLINAASGNEKKISAFIKEQITNYVDKVSTDNLGNVIAHKKGNGKKLMFVANMDEVGFFTTISNESNIKVAAIGNIEVKNINNCIIEFENGDKGVLKAENTDKISEYDIDMLTDHKNDYTGMTATFDSQFNIYGDKIISKALSSRIGCYTLIQLIKSVNSDFDLYFAFTVKKHIGLKGAKVVAFDIKPDYAVILDGCVCKEPSVIAKDKLYIADNTLKEKLTDYGFNVTVQKDLITQAGPVQVTGNGVKVAAVCTDVKYNNNQNEVSSVSQINTLISNLKKFAEKEF